MFGRFDNVQQPVHIREDQAGTLVGGKAAGKTDRQDVGIEQDSRRDHLDRVEAAHRPTVTDAFAQV
jgi:hypothetical protein